MGVFAILPLSSKERTFGPARRDCPQLSLNQGSGNHVRVDPRGPPTTIENGEHPEGIQERNVIRVQQQGYAGEHNAVGLSGHRKP